MLLWCMITAGGVFPCSSYLFRYPCCPLRVMTMANTMVLSPTTCKTWLLWLMLGPVVLYLEWMIFFKGQNAVFAVVSDYDGAVLGGRSGSM